MRFNMYPRNRIETVTVEFRPDEHAGLLAKHATDGWVALEVEVSIDSDHNDEILGVSAQCDDGVYRSVTADEEKAFCESELVGDAFQYAHDSAAAAEEYAAEAACERMGWQIGLRHADR